MDILYLLGSRSTWKDNEIRFSLRSVEKNVKDLGKVFVVGEKPAFLQNIIHIPFPDAYKAKWKNGYTKTFEACKNPELSDDFLLMNDDFFILKPIIASEYPNYYCATFSQADMQNKFRFMMSAHQIAIKASLAGGTARNFSVHRPVRLNKKKYLEMPLLDLTMTGFCSRGFYCNLYNVQGIFCKDENISPNMSEKQIEKMVENRTEVSIFSDTARNPVFQNWLLKKFPEPSLYEKLDY